MKLFWVALTGGSLALNIIQSATFPIPNSEVEFAHEARITTVLMQAIVDNVFANGGHLITLPAGRFYLDEPIRWPDTMRDMTIRGSSPDGATEMVGSKARG